MYYIFFVVENQSFGPGKVVGIWPNACWGLTTWALLAKFSDQCLRQRAIFWAMRPNTILQYGVTEPQWVRSCVILQHVDKIRPFLPFIQSFRNIILFVTVNISYMEQKHTFDCLARILCIVKRMRNAEVNRTKWQTLDFPIAVICGYHENSKYHESWSRHDMEIFSTLLAPCEGNPPVTDWFSNRFCVVRRNQMLHKQSGCQCLRCHGAHTTLLQWQQQKPWGHRLNFVHVAVTVPNEIIK